MIVKDGVSAIASEVLGDAQKEAEAILLAAENEAKATLKLAKTQSDQNYHAIITQATVKAESEKRKIASVTEVDMRNRLLQTKEELVDEAFEKAISKLKNFVKTDEYHDYLFGLMADACERIGQKKLVIQVNAKDQDWLTFDMLKSLSKKLKCELAMSDKTGNYIGGCVIQTSDSKIIYDVTIDNRLQEIKPLLRVELAKILFGEE
jgi:V/A-type H+/Na+-transporting ATPase subunit E